MVMTVDSIQFHRHSVHQQLLTVNPNITETDLAAACLDDIGILVKE